MGYSPVVPPQIGGFPGDTTISCGSALTAPYTHGRLCLEFSTVFRGKYYSYLQSRICFFRYFLLVEYDRTVDQASTPHACVNFSYDLSSASEFQSASTRFFVSSSINISSGHGRVNPSDAHFRVASIPIFDPKSCIRAA